MKKNSKKKPPHLKRGAAFSLLLQYHNQHCNSVKDYEVRGVKDVKQVFHLGFAALAVVEREERNGKERPRLNGDRNDKEVIENSYKKKNRCRADLPRARGHKVNENGQQNSPNAVVDIKVGILQKVGKNKRKRDHTKERANACKAFPNLFGFHNTVDGINRNDGKRKGNENALVKTLHRHKINDLKEDRHTANHTKIFGAVFGVAAALGNHVGKNWEGDAPKNAKDCNGGKEEQPHVVEQHADHSNDLELIVCQAKLRFFNSIHKNLTVKFLSCLIIPQKRADCNTLITQKRTPMRVPFYHLYYSAVLGT